MLITMQCPSSTIVSFAKPRPHSKRRPKTTPKQNSLGFGAEPRKEQSPKIQTPKPAKPKTKPDQTSVGFGAEISKDPTWQCIAGCGACCQLDKGPSFATPEEIFTDPADVEKYKSMVGPDGWCVHYEKTTRKCSIYADRPYFCRVEAEVFEKLYGIDKKKLNKEACSSCRDTIKAIYGPRSEELDKFNRAIKISCPAS